MSEQTALTVIEQDGQAAPLSVGPVMPVGTPEQMHNAMVLYQQMKEAVLDAKTDIQVADGKPFIKKSGWAKLAIAFGVSSAIMRRALERDASGALIRAEFVVRATAPNGRFAEGWGSCSIGEPRYTRQYDDTKHGNKPYFRAGDPITSSRQKLEHDLPATAETRARNRAYANLFGHGEVSYEEVDAGPRAPLDPEDEAVRVTSAVRESREPRDSYDRSEIKASPYKPATANQLATIAKLSRVLGTPEEPSEGMTSAEASERITELSHAYNERKGSAGRGGQDTPATEIKASENPQTDDARSRALLQVGEAVSALAEATNEEPREVFRDAINSMGLTAQRSGDLSRAEMEAVRGWARTQLQLLQDGAHEPANQDDPAAGEIHELLV